MYEAIMFFYMLIWTSGEKYHSKPQVHSRKLSRSLQWGTYWIKWQNIFHMHLYYSLKALALYCSLLPHNVKNCSPGLTWNCLYGCSGTVGRFRCLHDFQGHGHAIVLASGYLPLFLWLAVPSMRVSRPRWGPGTKSTSRPSPLPLKVHMATISSPVHFWPMTHCIAMTTAEILL